MPFTVPTLLQGSTDLILKSADGVAFRVHKTFLSLASSVFEDMFLVLQEPRTSNSSDELAFVDLAESGDVLSDLLSCIYPVQKIAVESLPVLRDALKAARKYEMELVVSVLRKDLTWPHFVQEDPLAVYSVACIIGLKEEAEEAAEWTLKWSVNDWSLEWTVWASCWQGFRPTFACQAPACRSARKSYRRGHCGQYASRDLWAMQGSNEDLVRDGEDRDS